MAGFEFNGTVAGMASREPSAFDVFNNAISQGTQSVLSLVNARNDVRAALSGPSGATSTAAQPSAPSSGVPSWVLFAVLGLVAYKVMK